jgi:ABC-type branched-subunit amino acid transport system ATPase component
MKLAVDSLRKSYGGISALADCSFALEEPGIYGLIGPNGAGKTTLFDVVAGIIEPDGGRVEIEGRDVTGLPPYRLAGLGVARSFQECRIFPEFTCLENLLFGPRATAPRDEALRLLDLVNLTRHADAAAGTLSFGERRLLELCAAFMMRPRILLLDEPAAGVNPNLLELLKAFLKRMHAEKPLLLLVVEHNMEFIMGLAGEIIVMHQGAVLERGSPAQVQSSTKVVEAYLG